MKFSLFCPSFLVLLALSCGTSSEKGSPLPQNGSTETKGPIAGPSPEPRPMPTPTPTPTANPTPGPLPTPGPTATPRPQNPRYVSSNIFSETIGTVLIEGLPSKAVLVPAGSEPLTLDLRLKVLDKKGQVIPEDQYKLTILSYPLFEQNALTFTFSDDDIDMVEYHIFVTDLNDDSMASVEFRLIKAIPDKAALATDFERFLRDEFFTGSNAIDMLNKVQLHGQDWFTAYRNAYTYYSKLTSSQSRAREFADRVMGQPEPSVWLEQYKKAYEFYFGVSSSFTGAEKFAEEAAGKNSTWLQSYRGAYDFYFGVSSSFTGAHEFARKVTGKADASAWLAAYREAYQYFFQITSSFSGSHSFADRVANKPNATEWLTAYQNAYAFYFKMTSQFTGSQNFAEKAADKTQPATWLSVYQDAYAFFFANTSLSSQSLAFAETAADKESNRDWLKTYKASYTRAKTAGKLHGAAHTTALSEANAAFPD